MHHNRSRRFVLGLTALIACLLLMGLLAYCRIGAGRALKVHASYPTQAKPQSKLWYAQRHWWAWLPDGSGSSIWRRDRHEWVRTGSLDGRSHELPGYADVWADEDSVVAVLVGKTKLSVAQLRFDADAQSYSYVESHTWPIHIAPIHSATITRDTSGYWWIAYDQRRSIWVRRSSDSDIGRWEDPIELGSGVDDDDLSVVFNTPEGVGVAWTDQIADRLCFRNFAIDDTAGSWSDIEIIAQGEKSANNHLNAAVASDGVVYLVTKSSRYVAGEPVLSLHARNLAGVWASHSYGNWSPAITPSRPLVLLTPDEKLKLVHTLLDSSIQNQHSIACRTASPVGAPSEVDVPIISARLDLRSLTSCKQPLPENAPWIILGSDRFGNVYEGEIPR